MDGRIKRRENRFDVQLSLVLKQGSRRLSLLTENVSYRGVFVRTDTPPPLRQLVRLEAVLPPGGVPFASHGMSVFVIKPGDESGRAPGAGVQFYGMGNERRAWEAFVNHTKRQADAGRPPMQAVALPSPEPEPVRRQYERVAMVLAVRPTSLDELLTMWTRDISAGGMFLVASERPAVGAELKLAVEHPATRAHFHLDAVVRRLADDPGGHGVGVEFVGLSDGRRREFFRFVTSSVPSMTPEELGLIDGK